MLWHGYGMDTGWIGLLWLLGAAGVGLMVFAAVRLAQATGGRQGTAVQPTPPAAPSAEVTATHPAGPSTARRILEERYARGEIDTEEFTERLRTLEGR